MQTCWKFTVCFSLQVTPLYHTKSFDSSLIIIKIWFSAAQMKGFAAGVWAFFDFECLLMLHTVNYSAQLSHANGAVTLACSRGRESVSQRWCWSLFHFSDGTSDTSAGAYRMLSCGEVSKSKKRTKSNEPCASGPTGSVGGWGHYAAPLGEKWWQWVGVHRENVTCDCQPTATGDTFASWGLILIF